MTAKQRVELKAKNLFTEFYLILFDSESDKGEEVLISILAIKLAVKHCELLLELVPNYYDFYSDVIRELKKL